MANVQVGRVFNVGRATHLRPLLDARGQVVTDPETGAVIVDQPTYFVVNQIAIICPALGQYTEDVVDGNTGQFRRKLTVKEARRFANNHQGLSTVAPVVLHKGETVAKKVKAAKEVESGVEEEQVNG